MQSISGASRHCPLLVIELARDMSSEPNTDAAVKSNLSINTNRQTNELMDEWTNRKNQINW